MKKIFIVIMLIIAFKANSQTIQSVSSDFNGKLNICADTIEHTDYSCQKMEKIDSLLLTPEYTNFLNMCKNLSGQNILTSFICQNTKKQSFTDYRRIIIKNDFQQWIYNVELLPVAQQNIYNDFINKIKTFVK